MFVPKDDLEWIKGHAEQQEDGTWLCKKTKVHIKQFTTGRSIWWPGFNGGPGEVRQVAHLFCPECNPSRVGEVTYGEPIYEDKLVER